jgi:hypothetical protein
VQLTGALGEAEYTGEEPVETALASMMMNGDEETEGMSEAHELAIEWIIANLRHSSNDYFDALADGVPKCGPMV